MHHVKLIFPPLPNKSARKAFAILAIASAMTTSVLADESSPNPAVSEAVPSNTVLATITVGSFPYGITVSPDNKTVYVANSASNSVSVIDATTNTLKTTISVGTYPEFSATTPDGTKLFVTNFGDDSVSVIDTATDAVTTTLPVGIHPQGIAVTPNGQELWVANTGTSNEGSVSFINIATGQTTSINVPGAPYWLSLSPNGKQAYLMNTAVLGYIQIINVATHALSQKVLGGGQIYLPVGLAVAPNGTLIVSDYYNYVAAITPAGVLKQVGLIIPAANVADSYYVGGVVASPNGKYVYAANYSGNSVVVLSGAQLKQVGQPIPTGGEPAFLGIAPNGKNLYVGNYQDGTVTVVNIAP